MSIGRIVHADSHFAFADWLKRFRDACRRAENSLLILTISGAALLPLVEALLRSLLGIGIPGALGYLNHLTLWVGFIGVIIAARDHQHLGLATAALVERFELGAGARAFVDMVSVATAAGLCFASVIFVRSEISSFERIGGWVPIWTVQTILPISFAFTAIHFLAPLQRGFRGTVMIVAGAAAIVAVAAGLAGTMWLVGLVVIAVATLLGAPIFVAVGGAALLLFMADAQPIAAVPVAAYRIATSPLIPTIPLFTLAGYILAEGGARHRLIRLFRALFGFLPGGEAIAVVLLCAFFATFTGASSLAIVALGGLVLPMLIESRYPERFSLGLVSVSGSIGLLFPPSVAVILYGVAAHVPIPDLFLAGLLPGLLMVLAISAYGFRVGRRAGVRRSTFDGREILSALWSARYEVALPGVVAAGILGGFATLTETAAVVLAYVLLVEVLAHRDRKLGSKLPKILIRSGALVGAMFAILGVAFGLGNFIVDSQIPIQISEWVRGAVSDKIVFLLLLNLFLLAVGSVMDIFSAIVILVPILSPIASSFGVHPAHLGIIFLANLELGYLTPPVGLNLFLSAGRFDRTIMEVCRASLPFMAVLFSVVLVITYLSWLSLWWQ